MDQNFIIGGSYWENGGLSHGGAVSGRAEMRALAHAGFNAISIPITNDPHNITNMSKSLQLANLFGVFILGTGQPRVSMTGVEVREAAAMYSCHTNFGGFVLSSGTGSRSVWYGMVWRGVMWCGVYVND